MCGFCEDLTTRKELIIMAIAEIIICVAAMVSVVSDAHEIFDTLDIIILVALALAAMAGVCLLMGAWLRNRYLVLIFIALIVPLTVVICILCGLHLANRWNFIDNQDRAFDILCIIGIAFVSSFLVYGSWQFLRELKDGEA